MKNDIIAIDGPPGSGKSTVARLIARETGFTIIDTGAMYRAAALVARKKGISLDMHDDLKAFLKGVSFDFNTRDGVQRIFVDGQDVENEIRTEQMGMEASAISRIPAVREVLVEKQRELGSRGGVICEGRDATTVIFPDAVHRFFLDASVYVRALRRYRELVSRGTIASFTDVLDEVILRDIQDSTREHSPLKIAEGVVYIDTSALDVEEVAWEILSRVRRSG